MQMERRTLAKGAAWAAPALIASTSVPAYAASTECGVSSFTAPSPSDENGSTTNWTVPAGVNLICFTVLGGAGGGYSANNPAGAGAKITGKLPVTPGDVLTLTVGSGGMISGGSVPGLAAATGGKGYGKGGDSVNSTPSNSEGLLQRFGGSGGAGSAILLNGTPVAIAGGGGGVGAASSIYLNPDGWHWKGARIAGRSNHPGGSDLSASQKAGSAGGSNGDARGSYQRTTNANSATPGEIFDFGGVSTAGKQGQGGAPGSDLGSFRGSSFDITVATAQGESGSSTAIPGQANGGNGRSQQIIYRPTGDPQYPGMLLNWGNMQITGGGGGGGYGGGAAGHATILYGGYNAQVVPQNAEGVEDSSGRTIDGRNVLGVMFGAASAGAAGGSYLASSVIDGSIEEGDNHNSSAGVRKHGAISFTF